MILLRNFWKEKKPILSSIMNKTYAWYISGNTHTHTLTQFLEIKLDLFFVPLLSKPSFEVMHVHFSIASVGTMLVLHLLVFMCILQGLNQKLDWGWTFWKCVFKNPLASYYRSSILFPQWFFSQTLQDISEKLCHFIRHTLSSDEQCWNLERTFWTSFRNTELLIPHGSRRGRPASIVQEWFSVLVVLAVACCCFWSHLEQTDRKWFPAPFFAEGEARWQNRMALGIFLPMWQVVFLWHTVRLGLVSWSLRNPFSSWIVNTGHAFWFLFMMDWQIAFTTSL